MSILFKPDIINKLLLFNTTQGILIKNFQGYLIYERQWNELAMGLWENFCRWEIFSRYFNKSLVPYQHLFKFVGGLFLG